MNTSMTSMIRIEVISENKRSYALELPFGAPYDEAFLALEHLKKNVEQMQQVAQERYDQQAKESETKGE